MTEARLRRLQWAVRITLALGVAASVTANILHARPNPISQAIAAWPPLALLITVELVTRIPVYRRALGVVRVVATAAIAGIAAWVSYHHMVGVVARYGETGTVPYLLPLSVDGLIIVASVSLVELAGRRDMSTPRLPAPVPVSAVPVPTPAAPNPAPAVPVLTPADPAAAPAPVGAARVAPVDQPLDAGETAPAVADHPPEHEPIDVELRLDAVPDAEPDDHDPDDPDDPTDDDSPDDLEVDHDDDTGLSEDRPDGHDGTDEVDADLAPDLVPLLPAARAARDELIGENRAVSRDALARRLRRNGHSIRNSGVSELLAALRQETRSVNGSRPTASV
ncbi:DUF2637 domain-containing protein [Actinoplanes sp. NBRC 103695]|uniref:DUF2637 domain-containing protein n=1 Tax=Actinoplanes sp. NBRC 103695 TaxID=3032202 RepID=UPI0024A09FA0|nr:DUF2637 domain-containing protein [Actinoplanes sp. NBRC 103695]GLY98825.1 hypothetical protein Acsp02_60790 [Actinoplanes sp. NBRC 103695]